MEQRLMEVTNILQIMRGQLSPQDRWAISPLFAGVSALARTIRLGYQNENHMVDSTQEQRDEYNRVHDEHV
eukprot:7897723-Prorocentrum_lima.AAC.1